MSEFKYFGCVLGEPGTDEVECHRKGVRGGELQLVLGLWLILGSCMRLLLPVLLYDDNIEGETEVLD